MKEKRKLGWTNGRPFTPGNTAVPAQRATNMPLHIRNSFYILKVCTQSEHVYTPLIVMTLSLFKYLVILY